MNRYNKIAASFTLKTSDLLSPIAVPVLPAIWTPSPNNIGVVNNSFRSSMTWSNVDIRSILGIMWDKYTYFRIILVSSLASSATVAHIPDTILIVQLQGLQFVNSSYSIKSKANSNNVQVGIVTFNTNYGSSFHNNDIAFVQFKKGHGIVDLTITLNSVASDTLGAALLFQNTLPTETEVFPQTCYTFRIEGVE